MSQFLTLEEVEHHVSALPRRTLEALALGPWEDDEDGRENGRCRVCEALDELDRDWRGGRVHARIRAHALEVRAWHEVLMVDLAEFVDVAHAENAPYDFADLVEDTGPRAMRVYAELQGALSYARCCLIYATARNQLAAIRLAVA